MAYFAADDWGFSPGINAGILQLARRGWLHSVSCAANAPYLEHGVEELRARARDGIRLSLHLCFTYGSPLSSCPSLVNDGKFFSHRRFMLRGLAGLCAPEDIRSEFLAQLQRLREIGLNVNHLDGHHHVHLLPFVARALQPVLRSSGIGCARVTRDPQHAFSFAQTLYYERFVHTAGAVDLESCHYLRPQDLASRERLRRKLARSAGRPLLVHPALYNDFDQCGMTDPLQEARVKELNCLMRFMGND